MSKINRLDLEIKKTLYKMLREQSENEEGSEAKEEKPQSTASNRGVISTAGAFGSGGRAKGFVTRAGSRAKDDPRGLCEDLGITDAASGGDLDAALDILRSAIHTNSVMSKAYTGAKMSVDKVKTRSGEKNANVIAVRMKELDRKNGVRFLAHTLTAAQNAKFLKLQGGLQFGRGNKSDIVIYEI